MNISVLSVKLALFGKHLKSFGDDSVLFRESTHFSNS